MKSLTLVVVILALSGVACGGGDGKSPADGDAGGMDSGQVPNPTLDSAVDSAVEPYPECDRAAVNDALGPPADPWTKPKPWTRADGEACTKLCPQPSFKCISEMCENGEDFVSCYISESSLCSVDGASAPCTTSYENLGCCAVDEGCFDTSEEFQTCTDTGGACAGTVMAFVECSNGDRACGDVATKACVGEATDGGVPDGGVPDGGAAKSRKGLSFELTNRWLRNLPRQVNGSIRLPSR